jgi:pimeloyl-ACP methyl ester carboxylesterase
MLPFPVPHDLFPVEHRFIDLDGARIHYVDEGAGEPVLLLHGNVPAPRPGQRAR